MRNTLTLIAAAAVAIVIYTQSCQLNELQTLLGEQAKSVTALETNNHLLRSEITRLTGERDTAIQELGEAKQAFMISRGAKRIARVVNAEANNQPELGQMLVARVVLNRVAANPGKTVDDIIDNKNAFADSHTYTDANMEAVLSAALDRRYSGIFTFFNPRTATNQAFVQRKLPDAVIKVGDHVFCQ